MVVFRPKMPRILVGMTRRIFLPRHRGPRCSASRPLWSSRTVVRFFPGSGMYKAGIAGDNAPRAVFSSLVGSHDARHHGCCDQNDSCPRFLFRLQKTVASPQLQFIAGHRHPVHAAHGPDHSADHSASTVAVCIWRSMSPLCGPCSLSAAVENPQLQLVEKLPRVLQTAEN